MVQKLLIDVTVLLQESPCEDMCYYTTTKAAFTLALQYIQQVEVSTEQITY